jgi:NMD protein affecting ribosome stability and mRNA decay
LEVDAALQRRIDTARRCPSCGRPLPIKYPYKICNRCYQAEREVRMVELWESD